MPLPNPKWPKSSTHSTASIWSKLKSVDTRALGRIVTVIGGITTILAFVFGKGYPLQIFTAEHLHKIVLPPQETTSVYLNTCIVENDGKTNAKDLVVQIQAEPTIPFRDLNIVGAEGGWRIEDGGTGSSHVRIYAPRLVATYSLKVTVLTDSRVSITCEAASALSRADEGPRKTLTSLHAGDFSILILGQFLSMILLAVWLYRAVTGKQQTENSSGEE